MWVLLQTVSVVVALIVPSELEAMHMYSPESWKLTGWICKPPDCSNVNLGTWTEPLAKTCDPVETQNNQIVLDLVRVIRSLSKSCNINTSHQCVFIGQWVMQRARHATFPPGDGWFWCSTRLAGKHSCVPLSYCVVRRGECKSGGHTCDTQREHETKEGRATAPSKHIVCQ